MKKVVAEHERIARAKVNFDKSEGLRLGAWRGSDTLPEPFRSSDGPVHILGVWFGPNFLLGRNWSEVQAKVDAQVGTWLPRWLSINGRAEVCALYVFSLIINDWLYFICLRYVSWRFNDPSPDYSGEAESRWSVDRFSFNLHAIGGLSMPDLVSHWLAERIAYLGRSLSGDAVWRRKQVEFFPASR